MELTSEFLIASFNIQINKYLFVLLYKKHFVPCNTLVVKLNLSRMKPILIVSVFFILLFACKKDEFYRDNIPGTYIGQLVYYSSPDSGGSIITSNLYQIKITRVGSNYVLSFDKSYKYQIPDLTVMIKSNYRENIFAIQTLEGQEYISSHIGGTYLDEPPNYFSVDKYPQVARCNITLKRSDPDSPYYLWFDVQRTF